ncbi:MAG: tetratricopeptide repeat protein [Chthoniobacterales bacterium]|nr:tetratricopeptide repeat protein [Chthoniobacterales bacterium]
MNKIGLLLLPAFAFLALAPASFAQENDPSEVFLKVYMTAQQAEKMEREGQLKSALAKFRFAGSMIEELKKTSGDWQPAIVESRGRKIGEAILRVQSKIDTKTDLAANAGPAPSETGKPVLPEGGPSEPSVEIWTRPRPKPVDVQAAQVLMAQNSDLQKKLASAENTVREISAERPRKVQELQAVKGQLEKLRTQLVTSQKADQDSEKMIAELRAQLAHAKLNGATPEDTERLVKENQMLRAIVVRERQEEARREQARKLMLAEFDKLKIKSDVLGQQIHLLAQPITKLSPEELALLKTPVVSISDTAPGTIKASLTMAKPPSTITIGNSPEAKEAADKTSLNAVAEGEGNPIGPEISATFKPGVPADLIPLAREAKMSFDQGKYKQAEKQYQDILTKSPNDLYALSNLGVVLFRNGKLEAAELTLKKAIAIAPKDEFTHTALGIVYYQQSKFDDALSELTKSLAINPKSATAHNYLGITASQKGWQEAAEKEMLAAIEVNPEYADAHFNLAVVYSTSQPPAKELARRHYEKALALGAAPDPTLDKLLR